MVYSLELGFMDFNIMEQNLYIQLNALKLK